MFSQYIVKHNTPSNLQELPQWVAHKNKRPIDAITGQSAKINDACTWHSQQEALDACEKYHYDGIGFVFIAGQGYVGIDIDTCIDIKTGRISDGAMKIVKLFNSYTEISPSGYGLHIYILAAPDLVLPFNKQHMKPNGIERYDSQKCCFKQPEVEIYNGGRYFTFTGNLLSGSSPMIQERTKEVQDFISLYPEKKTQPKSQSLWIPPTLPEYLDDDAILQKAFDSANGHQIKALFRGDISGYSSHSNADQALCNYLAFWFSGDEYRIDRMFRQSGLMRDKWDERHGDMTYGQRTIENAISSSRNYYCPHWERRA